MHNNLQASVRVEYAFYAGQSLQCTTRIKGGLPRINLYVTETNHKRWHDSRLASRVPETNPVIETPVLETAEGDDRECGLLVPHRRSQSIVLR